MNKRNRIITIGIGVVLIVAFCVIKIIQEKKQIDGDAELNTELKQIAETTTKVTPMPTATPQPTVESTTQPSPTPAEAVKPIETPERKLDFNALQEQNKDIIAWIEVPGTVIDYPILQSDDNVYYLNHNVKHQKTVAAAIFMDFENSNDFTDKNTVIYGHNMNNGSMFAALHKYENTEFFNNNKVVKIYTPDGQLNYEITAAFVRDNMRILHNANFEDDTYFQLYLDEVAAKSGKKDNVSERKVTVNDHIVTLSTCIKNQSDKRYVVQMVLVNE